MSLAIVAAIFVSPVLLVLPLEWGWAMWAVVAAVPVLLFWFGDLLSALLSALVASLVIGLLPTFFAGDFESWGMEALTQSIPGEPLE